MFSPATVNRTYQQAQPHYVPRADGKRAYLLRAVSGWYVYVGAKFAGMRATWGEALALAQGEVS